MFNSFNYLGFNPCGEYYEHPMAQNFDNWFAQPRINYQQQYQQNQQNKPEIGGTASTVIAQQQEKDNIALEIPQKKSKTEKSKKQLDRIDADYRPNQRNRPTKTPKGARQKQDRNLIPNAVHHIIAFVQKKYRSGKLVEKIMETCKHEPQWNLNRFYIYHKLLKVKINTYVNQSALTMITQPGQLGYDEFSMEQQKFFCLISKILIKHFLKGEAILNILLSKKVKKENVMDHLRVQRYILHDMRASNIL